MERLGFWGLLMGSVEKSSNSGNSMACSASMKNGDEESSTSSKQAPQLKGSRSRNTSPLGRVGSRNTSPSRQKVVKTKPRGFEEETVASFGKPVVADVQIEDGIWAMLPEDLLNEILARVPPFMIFRIRSVCKKWNSILQDNSFLKFHSNVSSNGPCLLTFWKNSLQNPQCSVFSLPLKTWYKVPFHVFASMGVLVGWFFRWSCLLFGSRWSNFQNFSMQSSDAVLEDSTEHAL